MTLTKALIETCGQFPERTAIIDDAGEMTYGKLLAAVKLGGALLRSATSQPNVGIVLPSCKEFAAAYFSVLAAGKTPVPLNLLMSREQIAHILHEAGIDTVLSATPLRPLLDGQVPNPVYLDELPPPSSRCEGEVHLGDPDELAVLLYTSGTSSAPKGVMLTHQNLLRNIEATVEAFRFTADDVILGILPLFHSFGLMATLALPISVGAKVVYLKRFSPAKCAALIGAHSVTGILGIASLYRILVRHLEKNPADFSSLRLCVAGGEALPLELTETFNKICPVPLLEGYGLTETSPVVSVNEIDSYKFGTAGRPIEGVEVRIVDDDGEPLPTGGDGEIWVRGHNIMKGYYKRPEETAEAITQDGWFKTGDIGRLDQDGFLKITGRKKELIISSGENISPNEIEEAISRHPAVFEVGVIGVPDPTRGEAPKAFVALNEGAEATQEDLRSFCRDKLPAYKIPKEFEFRPELPHGLTGKVLRRELR